MDQKLILDAIHAAVWRKRVSQIYTHKDMYKFVTGDIDLSNLKIDIVLKNKEILSFSYNLVKKQNLDL